MSVKTNTKLSLLFFHLWKSIFVSFETLTFGTLALRLITLIPKVQNSQTRTVKNLNLPKIKTNIFTFVSSVLHCWLNHLPSLSPSAIASKVFWTKCFFRFFPRFPMISLSFPLETSVWKANPREKTFLVCGSRVDLRVLKHKSFYHK